MALPHMLTETAAIKMRPEVDVDDVMKSLTGRLTECGLTPTFFPTLFCLGDPFMDMNFVGTVCLKSKKTEIVAQGESAHEGRVEYEEFMTQIITLFLAAHSGNLALVRKLLSYGANVNQNLFRGYTTAAAVRNGHLEMGWHNSDLMVELEYTNWCSGSRKRERAESEKKKAKAEIRLFSYY
ncbi:hypothetical protein ACFX13_024162 [Malus domestica]